MASPQHPTIAFFGATGGCTSVALALTLKAGYHATALARTPKKLHDMLLGLEVPESTIASNLTIVEGPAQDLAAVKATLAPNNKPVELIIFGIGQLIKPQASIRQPFTLDDPHVCEDSFRTIATAVRDLIAAGTIDAANKPRVLAISTTGISKSKDVPCAFIPFYHYALTVPHEDKKVLERLVIDGARDGLFDSFVIVRPAFLTDGKIKGCDNLRVGWEFPEGKDGDEKQQQAPGPAIGYTISRGDVGNWIFHEVIDGKPHHEWDGGYVSLTY